MHQCQLEGLAGRNSREMEGITQSSRIIPVWMVLCKQKRKSHLQLAGVCRAAHSPYSQRSFQSRNTLTASAAPLAKASSIAAASAVVIFRSTERWCPPQ